MNVISSIIAVSLAIAIGAVALTYRSFRSDSDAGRSEDAFNEKSFVNRGMRRNNLVGPSGRSVLT